MKKVFLIPLMLVLLGALLFGGCAKPAPPSPEEILIGASESPTGMYAGFAIGGIFGMKAAVADINKQGGVFVREYGGKLPVKLIVRDNESSSEKAANLAEDLIVHDKVHILVNSPGPTVLLAPIAMRAERYQIPYVAGFGPLESWYARRMADEPPWQYVWGFGFALGTPAPAGDFRHGKPGYTIADTWGAFMDTFGEQTNKKIAVFATDDPDGRGWFSANIPALEKMGYEVIGKEKELGMVPVGTTDFSSVIAEWKKNNAEVMWGMASGADFGTMWRQAHTMGYVPKMVMIAKAPLFYEEVSAWGGDLPMGVGVERWWDPAYPGEFFPGIGDTTPKTLFERWYKETGQALNQGIGWGYVPMQVVFDAIERAGTLEGAALNKAIAETDMMSISGRIVFTPEEHHCRLPLTFGQWRKTDKPWVWECPITVSKHDFIKPTAEPIFPIPSTTFK